MNLFLSFQATAFSQLYGLITVLLFAVALIMSRDYFPKGSNHMARYYTATGLTLIGILGVFFAADLPTLFVFFEVMSLSSCLWVAHNHSPQSQIASGCYLAFSVVGGLAILMGIFLLYDLCPDLLIANLTENFASHIGSLQLTVACVFLFLGFGIKAGAFFLHDWLPLAHVAAPAPTSGLLSGLLTKAGIYGILLIALRILSGWTVFALFLLIIALLNMIVGGIFALFSGNLKSTLAYSSVSQIGFILWGISLTVLLGEHGAIAAYGTLFHMVNHSLIKVLLFSLVGVVYQNAHSLDLNQLRGWGRGKPLFHALFIIGAGSVSGLPLLSGYISKTLLHEAMTEYIILEDASLIFSCCEGLFLLAGGCTLAYMLKLYHCLFWSGRAPENNREYASLGSKIALSTLACCLVLLGTVPHLIFDAMGDYLAEFFGVHHLETMAYFSLTNLTGSAISIMIGLFLFVCLGSYRKMRGGAAYSGVSDGLPTLFSGVYRPAVALLGFLGSLVARIFDLSTDVAVMILRQTLFAPLAIPDSFYEGDPTYGHHQRTRIHITFSLAYSLLMFGIGFLCTIAALLFLGGQG